MLVKTVGGLKELYGPLTARGRPDSPMAWMLVKADGGLKMLDH